MIILNIIFTQKRNQQNQGVCTQMQRTLKLHAGKTLKFN